MIRLKGFLKKKEGEIVGIASTEKEDRHGEIIKQDGWDLKLFKNNPVILASHQYQDFPIGKATSIRVKDDKLIFKAVFSESTAKAKEAYALVKEGILNSFSVGFIPKEWDKKKANVITKAELMEISLVSIPANPQAVVTAKGMKGDLTESLVKHWLVEYEKELEEIDTELKRLDKKSTLDKSKGETKKVQKEVVGRSLDVKLLQKTTGCLQELCRQAKRGGEEN